jgi:gas vesicle protein
MVGEGRFIAGLLVGAFVGASLAMVLVPAPESEMRDRIRDMARTGSSPTT